jgi:hypothetical protein
MDNTLYTNKQAPNHLAPTLTYLGALPFLCAVLLSLSPYLNLPNYFGGNIAYPAFKSKALMHSYGAIILSFLAGIQWGSYLHNTKQIQLLIISNIIAVFAWLSLMVFATKLALFILLIGFITTLITDFYSNKNQIIPLWFWELRKRISIIVCLSILTVIII